MAHFAELNDDNTVLSVVVVNNDVLLDDNGEEQESLGVSFLNDLYGHSRWKQCSYNGNFRKFYPGIGWSFLESLDCFVFPRPFTSWSLNESTGEWEAPVDPPSYDNTTHFVIWDEQNLQWITRLLPPEHDQTTHYVIWNEETEQWDVVEKPEPLDEESYNLQ